MRLRIIALLLLISAGIAFLAKEFDYPFPWNYPIRGLDISHHQGTVDWEKLRRGRIDFVYIKATEGVDYTDRQFITNWQGAGRTNIKRGAYHFFSLCKAGKAQAQNFIRVARLSEGDLPPAVDLEFVGGKNVSIPGKTQLAAALNEFETEIYAACGMKPIYYVTEDFYEHYFKGQEPSCALWIRGIYHKPAFMPKVNCVFWQYSDIGSIDGIKGHVDFNVFNGGQLKFAKVTEKPELLPKSTRRDQPPPSGEKVRQNGKPAF